MLLNVEDVQKILKVKQAKAYKVIRDLNDELKDKGFLTINGRVEERYLLERYNITSGQEKRL